MNKNKSLYDIQKIVDNWITKHGGYWHPLAMLGALIEELGELSREINSKEGFKPKKDSRIKDNVGEELADLLFALICIANHYKVDLEEEVLKSIEKFNNRDSYRFE
ncbi:MAG: nucleotide pyrophosphohydrolase [Candidatus Lokiarchaeota archaeon]|nr:nucleotide pyrophosphohydrolase [Candidatus Lokiarchaeota archaeon]